MAQCGVVWPGMAWYGFVLVACYPSGATNYPLSENWSQTITDKAPCHLILGSGHNRIQDAWVVHTWLYQDAWFPVFSAHSNLVLQYPLGPMFMSHGRSWYPTMWGTDTEDSTKMTDTGWRAGTPSPGNHQGFNLSQERKALKPETACCNMEIFLVTSVASSC